MSVSFCWQTKNPLCRTWVGAEPFSREIRTIADARNELKMIALGHDTEQQFRVVTLITEYDEVIINGRPR